VCTISSGARRAMLAAQLVEHARERFDGEHTSPLETFLGEYYSAVPMRELDERAIPDLYGSALAHWLFAQGRSAGEARVRAYNHSYDDSGWQRRHTVVEVVADEIPFLVSSVTAALGIYGLGIHLASHVTLRVVRDASANIVDCETGRERLTTDADEAYLHVKIDRVSD
jgi:glutamate dehydrogenase